ncbi:DnaJ family domain-containing protein [Streptomyces sparsus]
MTERKPHGMSVESWVDRQIREAAERGAFDDLPGAGKPLTGADGPYDENWWIKDKLQREGVSVLPPALALRKETEDALAEARGARSEAEVRRIVTDVNDRIRQALRFPPPGPPLRLTPLDVEQCVRDWRRSKRGEAQD